MIPAPYQLHSRIGMACAFASQAPTAALARVLREGDCEMLGAFSLIPPSDKHGWVCRVSTRNGADRFLALVTHRYNRQHWVIEIDRVPWEYWEGRDSGKGWAPSSGDRQAINAERYRTAFAIHDALSFALSVSPEQTTDDPPTPRRAAERQASGPHFWNRALDWARRLK